MARRRVSAASVADATRQREAIRAELHRGERERERVRLATYAELWLLRKLPAWRASTATQNASALEVHVMPTLGDYYLDAIEPADVAAWRDAMARTPVRIDDGEPVYPAPASVNSRLRLLRQVLGDAAAEYGIANPAARVEPLRIGYVDPAERSYYPDASEARALLDWHREHAPQWYPLVETLALTGLRFGEASALRWSDVDFDGGWIHVRRAHVRGRVDHTKSAAGRRVVPLLPQLGETLRAHQAATGRVGAAYVFASSRGTLHTPSVLTKPMRAACEACGLPWERVPAVKVWRKVWNNLLRQVTSETVRQALVGHAGAEVGRRHYSSVGEDEMRSAAGAVLRLVTGGEK